MALTTVITWLWGTKYGARDVSRLCKRVKDTLKTPHRFVAFCDRYDKDITPLAEVRLIEKEDFPLMTRSCFVRLRMFDPNWQRQNGFDERIISIDLDNVIIDRLDQPFNNNNSFMILQHVNTVNPNPFNASVMMLRAGMHPEVWMDFTPEKAARTPFHEFPDDQGWIHYKLPNALGWTAGPSTGIYGFKKKGWPGGSGTHLPPNAKIICFMGYRKPIDYSDVSWIQKYWLEA